MEEQKQINGDQNDENMQIEENPEIPNNQQQTINDGSQNANSSSSFMPNEKETQPSSSSIVQLFDTYSNFIGNSSDVILDMDLVLDRLLDALKKLQPPQNASQNTMNMWNYLLDLDKEGIESYANSLKNLPPNTLYDVLQNTERLYLKLALEFDQEINRGKRLGIIKTDGTFES